MAHLFHRLTFKELAKVPVRFRNGPDHWATIKKKKTPKDKALKHFDEFYATVYGNAWPEIRAALLQENNKHMAVVNNFSDTDRIRSDLELQGAINLRAIYNTFKEDIEENMRYKKEKKSVQHHNLDKQMSSFLSNKHLSEVQSVYPKSDKQLPEQLRAEEDDSNENESNETKGLEPVELKSIETDQNEVNFETSRIIKPSVNLAALYEYVPATKLKGMSDWVLESEYYSHYTQGSDFVPKVEKESLLNFPGHLHVYTFEAGSKSRFKSPKTGSTNVLDYYLFDGGSILPVLALDLQPGDIVLDMCAAPGGKALTILQTLLPRIMVANDVSRSRVTKINNVIKQYISDVPSWNDRLFVTEQDARDIEEKDSYNKILVDVPCTTDRHVLHSDDNNLFKPTRVKERLKIPELQTEILTNALKLVAPGGTVVYSTCSLSPVQNDGVVQLALKKTWEESDSVMVVKDLSEALRPLNYLFQFANIDLKYGSLVVPALRNNWGPMYFCKIVRVR